MRKNFNPPPPHGGRRLSAAYAALQNDFNPLPPHGGRRYAHRPAMSTADISIHSLRMEGDGATASPSERGYATVFQSTPSAWRETDLKMQHLCQLLYFNPLPPHGGRPYVPLLFLASIRISIHSLRMEGDSKTAQESVFHFAYPCTILQKRMQKTTFCTRKNGFFRKKGEKFGAKPSASFCAPMIRTDTFPLNFSHRISGSSMSMVSFAPICSTFD